MTVAATLSAEARSATVVVHAGAGARHEGRPPVLGCGGVCGAMASSVAATTDVQGAVVTVRQKTKSRRTKYVGEKRAWPVFLEIINPNRVEEGAYENYLIPVGCQCD